VIVVKKMARRISAAARTNVLLEDMRSRIDAIGENVISSKDELMRNVNDRFVRLDQRLDRVEDAIRYHSNEIAETRAELRQLRHDFAQREELARLDALERRVEVLEKRRTH
jgi:predicted  nucleic acid-binding Zn-ribbon protein